MLSFFERKKNIQTTTLLAESVDVHTHLLPGVDDGIPDLMEAFTALKLMQKVGVKNIYLTPHVMTELPGNTHKMLTERFQILKNSSPEGLELKLAAEYMLDTSFRARLKEGLLTFDGRHVLLETSYLSPPPELYNMLYDITLEGYIPILAHPERYLYMTHEDYIFLHNRGYKFQLNLFSLTGIYGKHPQQNADYLLKQGLYDYAGSDLHSIENYRIGLKLLSLTNIQEKELRRILINNNTLWQLPIN